MGVIAALATQQVLRQQRLAHAASADERDQAIAMHELGERAQVVVAAEQRR